MRLLGKQRPTALRWALAASLVWLASYLLLLGSLRHDRLNLDIGPGDVDYVQGLSDYWRYDGERTWRQMGRRARVQLPVTVQGPGNVVFVIAQPASEAVELRIELDDGTTRQMTIPPFSDYREVVVEIPETRARASVRLRSETQDGSPGVFRIDKVEWRGLKARPQAELAWKCTIFLVLSLIAFGLAGLTVSASLVGTLMLATILWAISFHDPFAAIHLLRRAAPLAMLGLPVIGVARLVARRLSPWFLSLLFGAILLKGFVVFHPSFFFTDLPIHETLLELVYHRGVLDFWSRLPQYQMDHNLGVAPVAGVYQAFPYPVAFYLLAHLGNSFHHAPILWLKLGGALISALALLPVGYLARRLSGAPQADLFAGIIYLFIPAYTRSLLLLELSALLGHLLDLVVIAYLARISLSFFPARRIVATMVLIAASLAVYTSGFIHQGLFVGSLLILAPIVGGLDRPGAARLAGAGLAGAALGLLAYHPETVSNVFAATLPAGTEVPGANALSLGSRLTSATARALEFLGSWAIVLGTAGVTYTLWRASSAPLRPLRLLVAAWALSGAVAYALRYYFLELFHFQKELYWVGAMFAVGAGVMTAGLRAKGRVGLLVATALLLAVVIGGLLAFSEMAPRFYERYVFL